MKKIEWTTKTILKTVFWGVFALMIVIAALAFRQKGLWVEGAFDSGFYKLKISTEQQRIFHGEDSIITQMGFFPDAQEVYVEIKAENNSPVLWTLTRESEEDMTISNGEVSYTGTYRVNDLSGMFYFDDWDKYWDDWTVSYDGTSSVITHYGSQELFGSFIRMAYGHTDNYGEYSMGIFIPWLFLMMMAYVVGFHAEQLFELRKAFEFDYRNAENLEPSDWYFISSYIGAGCTFAISLFIFLHMIGIIV